MKKALIIAAILLFIVGVVVAVTTERRFDNVTSNPVATSTPVSTSTPSAPSVPNSNKVTINGVTITPFEVVEDSRCPEGVQCIWAGTFKLNANLSKPSGNFNTVLELGKSVSTGTEDVTLVSVTPNPKAGNKINFADYDFEFTVKTRPSASNNAGAGGCFVGGCSGQICSEENGAVSTCEYRESYACYKTAKCERQPSGQCGWTPTTALNSCLMNSQ